ncbi:uncharacterized protein LOC126894164 [Daktulosphaira vitifoliae]|uniref:uncharacterized protein LOC126894164 n=1 Tax=Daktulosphaira vitifoliae TaxID=58002 RepID=UPI0021AA2344|nr:uncharacterized protein LOC126894164 [Daktulosphaira vitifoliae]
MDVDSSSDEEIVEENYIHVTVDNPDEFNALNVYSNARIIGIDTESPILQVHNKIYHCNEWKYIDGTAIFFEQLEEKEPIDPLYDNRSDMKLLFIGSTRKCLELTKKDVAFSHSP